ncbi:MAG: hypothetical protein RL022_1807, partial [Chloroflexota bacterium]
ASPSWKSFIGILEIPSTGHARCSADLSTLVASDGNPAVASMTILDRNEDA